MSQGFKAVILSLLVGILNFVLKLGAYFITHSVAIYSDAMESIINIVSAGMAILGMKIALKPPDEEHPYGHTKVEYLFSIVEALFILGAGFSILWEAIRSLILKHHLQHLYQGLGIVLLTLILNSIVAAYLYYSGKKENSPILLSHGSHIFADVLTTGGVIVGVVLAKISKLEVIDSIIAILVSVHILKMGISIVKESGSSLLDKSLPQEDIRKIRETLTNLLKNSCYQEIVYDITNFRTRKAGRRGFLEFDLVLPGHIPVETACKICECMKSEIKRKFPQLIVNIHIKAKKD